MNRIEQIALMCHEANRLWCIANSDFSQKHWPEAEEWQRQSTIASVQFRLDNPDAGPNAQHDAWRANMINNGWVYGPIKDA